MDRPQTESSEHPTKRATRHSWNSTHVLKKWHTLNSVWPYPSPEEKQELSRYSGLSVRQVSQWFVNARRRSEERSNEKHGSLESHLNSSLPRTRRSASLGGLSSAVSDGTFAKSRSQSDISTKPRTSAIISRNSIASCPSESHSSYSEHPDVANHQESQNECYRLQLGNGIPEDKSSRIYQCTFCTDTFKTRYDWTRHEGTLHLALEQWICLPTGPKRWDLGDLSPKCSLCDERDPSNDHLQSHRISDCIAKPISLRSFHRKDHLHQHLRLAHGVNRIILSMNSWSSKLSEVKSRCGFCEETFSLWTDRNDHLADHFRRGKSMKDWKGDRGFEPSIAMLVQSAMPPYLIGAESLDIEPFSASKGIMKKKLTHPGAQNPANVFELLTARLSDFVTASRASGATINCDILRRQARLILYGDDDPLNQTPADNDQWLTLFKIGHGLASAPSLQQIVASAADGSSTHSPISKTTTPLLICTNNLTVPRRMSVKGKIRSEDDSTEPTLPWWCQSPECLAELMQMSQEFALTTLGDIEINNGLNGEYQI
ncbi:hypothetical protein ACQKWADRAFT_305660 [Trichoderma austrokoningii]